MDITLKFPDWIPVTNSLPAYDYGVLFVADDTVYIGCRDHTNKEGEHWVTWMWDTNENPEVKATVTHWMECPRTPNELAAAKKGEDS